VAYNILAQSMMLTFSLLFLFSFIPIHFPLLLQ